MAVFHEGPDRVVRDQVCVRLSSRINVPDLSKKNKEILGCKVGQSDHRTLQVHEAVTSEAILFESGLQGCVAVQALARVSNSEAGPVLRQAVLDAAIAPDARVSICKALARIKEPASTRTLADVLADPASPPEVRATAADSLGRLRDPDAIATVAAAAMEDNLVVARQARLAHARLSHVK